METWCGCSVGVATKNVRRVGDADCVHRMSADMRILSGHGGGTFSHNVRAILLNNRLHPLIAKHIHRAQSLVWNTQKCVKGKPTINVPTMMFS
jgi:hypothetical protein